ncbi:cysteine proteinase [Abortiporus biennis]|nr:cysteine proteinase [Abortiporus biennis]
MMKELYEIKRSTDLIDYRRRLELLEAHDSILTTTASRSLTDLHEKTEQEVNRRHSQSDEQFLLRAIERARASLNTPKPPKPFSPAFDNLRVRGELQDESIEKRIRPKAIPIPDSLPPQDEEHVRHLLRKKGVIAKCVREQVMDKDLALLKPSEWLNDEVINFYGQMILSRSEACKENPGAKSDPKARGKPLNVHYFSTFFWAKLKGEGYERARLAKWTKKIDIFSKDIILIPINHNNAHWTAAAINFRQKRIESYDSMGMERPIVYKLLRMYLDAEHRNKKKKPFDFTGWVDYVMEDIPQQENMFDCGVFTCQFLEYLSRGEEYFPFSQPNMPYFRRRMIWEIGNCKLRDDP